MRQSQSRSTKPWSVPLAHPLDSDMFHVVSLSLSVFVASPCCTKCVAEACFGASFCVPWGVRLEETGEGCGGESWLTTQWLRAICAVHSWGLRLRFILWYRRLRVWLSHAFAAQLFQVMCKLVHRGAYNEHQAKHLMCIPRSFWTSSATCSSHWTEA
jgi:hypothetical protein